MDRAKQNTAIKLTTAPYIPIFLFIMYRSFKKNINQFADVCCSVLGYIAVAFSAVYTTIILLVYFAQLTTVRFNDLTQQAAALLDFQQCGLLFNYDLLEIQAPNFQYCYTYPLWTVRFKYSKHRNNQTGYKKYSMYFRMVNCLQ